MIRFNSADLAQLRLRPVRDALAKLLDAKRLHAGEGIYQQRYDSALQMWEAGSKKRAVAQLERALRVAADRAGGWCRLGEFYNELSSAALLIDDYREADRLRDKAVAALNKAITLSPAFAEAHYALADVYWGWDFRIALAELEAAAKCGPQNYQSVLETARTTVQECTYQLARMNVIILNSAQEMRSTRMLQTEFFFVEFRIGCAVMHSCVADSQRHWAYVWLFEAEHPDLDHDEPVAELSVSSTGDVSISAGCPANYHMLKVQAAGLGVLTGWLAKNGPPAAYASAGEVLVENAGTHVRADQPESLTGRDESTSSQAPMTPAPDLSTPANALSVLIPAATQALERETTERANVPSVQAQRILWICLGVVVVAATAGHFYFKGFGALPTSDEQAHVSVELPGLLPAAGSDAAPEPVAPAAAEPVLLNAEASTAGSRSPDAAAPLGSADAVRTLSIQRHTQATQVTVFDPPHEPTTTEPAVAEAAARTARLRAESSMERMQRELAQCGEMGFLQRTVCVERTRWNHCHPDSWNKSPECAVQ